MAGVAAHKYEVAEPAIDEEGTDDADHLKDEDNGPLVENVFETATVDLVHAQEESEVRRQAYVQCWRSGEARWCLMLANLAYY